LTQLRSGFPPPLIQSPATALIEVGLEGLGHFSPFKARNLFLRVLNQHQIRR
jgi:hypothetical protein